MPVETVMKDLKALGFDGIELGVFDLAKDGSPNKINQVKQLLSSYGLEVPNMYIDIAGH